MTIDVMLPFYGDEALLREAVDSVRAQDDPGWRLTVVDDAYPDPAAAGWVGDLDDERVTLVRNERNLGVSRTFQRCLDLAEAEWVVFMGGDDRMLAGYVSRMRTLVQSYDAVAYVQPGVRVIDATGAPTRPLVDRVKARHRPRVDEPTVLDSVPTIESLLKGNWAYFPSICWRRELIAGYGFSPRYETVLDWWLQMQLLADGHRMLLDPEVTFEYRRHAEAASSRAALDVSRFHEEKSLLLDMRDIAAARGWRRARRIAAVHASSRLHALVTVASGAGRGRFSGSRDLLVHAFTNRSRPGLAAGGSG
jgi:glycosyltransferase involved in cell wall biosynthesis